MAYRPILVLLVCILIMPASLRPYPIDGYALTGIARLAYLQDILDGQVEGKMPLPGARKSIDDISLILRGDRGAALDDLPQPDPRLQEQLDALFGKYNPNYSIAVMDITPGRPVRYAQRKGNQGYQPGSVGKLAVAAGFFRELAALYPERLEQRRELLRYKKVPAGQWALPVHHTIPFYDTENRHYYRRRPEATDTLTLFEWLDHMLSVSSNGAASVVWREAILMHVFGARYPSLDRAEADAWFENTPRAEIQDITVGVVNGALRELGIGQDEWRLGSMFTHNAKRLAPGKGGSLGTPVGLMKFLVAIERGELVDPWSSLEIKRLMYMTDRRIRYASAPALDEAAVYFKSGSLYGCKAGTECGKYKGNRMNFMNSVAIVEQPDGTTYLAAMMSNVLEKNSAWDHRVLAAGIDKLMREGEVLEEAETYEEGKLAPEN